MPVTGTVVVNGSTGLLSSRQMLAANGGYFTVANPTPGTAIVWALVTSFSATANGLFVVQNTGSKNIYLDYLWLKQTATVPTGTLSLNFDFWNETGIVTGTGAVASRTPVGLNTGSGSTQSTGAVVQSFAAGAITIPAAAGTRRLLGQTSIPTGVTLLHDSFRLDFGADGPGLQTVPLTAVRATACAAFSASAPPIIVAPQTTSWINAYWVTAAANTPSLEFTLGYFEL